MKKTKEIWKKFLQWPLWQPNPVVTLLLTAVSAIGLIWVFSNGMDNSPIAYLLYPVSAYALVIFLVLLWRGIPKWKVWMDANPVIRKLQETESDSAFGIGMYVEQFINFFYGIFKIGSGIVVGSAWIGADGIYNFVQALIQLYQILQHKQANTLEKQWKSYIQCGYMIFVLHLTITGPVFQMIHMGRHEDSTEIMIIATAAFTFYKLISAMIDVSKDRKHKNPVDSSARYLNFSQALYNLFVLQVGLLWVFGGESYPYTKLMNSLTGGAVCLLVCGMGIYMVWRGKRDLKKIEKSTE